MTRLAGKRTLITGGTSGIGLETAKQFLNEGARVAVTGLNEDTIAAARKELGSDALIIRADAGSVAGQRELAATMKENFEQLDAVFVNAGVGVFRPLDLWDEASFDRSFAINLKGPFFLLKELLPILANPASIILNASVNAHIGMPNSSVYSATKAGLISLARTLSGELITQGIRINAISPGPVSTPIYRKLGLPADQLEQMAESLRLQMPVKRFGDPVEIAKAVVFLASDESAFMVGSETIVDGGFSAL
jgi:NAD(P)-dependent dehydrogenase (short-subunit alcohol dehydrogenase family)